MKRKFLAPLTAAIAAVSCAFCFAACGDGNTDPELTALQKAYASFGSIENVTITVTDSRIQKDVFDLSSFAEMDYSNKVVHNIHDVFETYTEVNYNSGNIELTTYNRYDSENNLWNVSDSVLTANGEGKEAELDFLCSWVCMRVPAQSYPDMTIFENEDDEAAWASMDLLADKFTQNGNDFTASFFIGLNDEGVYKRYACDVTISLDAQGRFDNVVMDFGANGQITTVYVYGNANVVIPEEVLQFKNLFI